MTNMAKTCSKSNRNSKSRNTCKNSGFPYGSTHWGRMEGHKTQDRTLTLRRKRRRTKRVKTRSKSKCKSKCNNSGFPYRSIHLGRSGCPPEFPPCLTSGILGHRRGWPLVIGFYLSDTEGFAASVVPCWPDQVDGLGDLFFFSSRICHPFRSEYDVV